VLFSSDNREEAQRRFEELYEEAHDRLGSFCERRGAVEITAADYEELDIITLDEFTADYEELDIITLDEFTADYGTSTETVELEEEIL
jgi:hypothetical protein